MDIALHRHHVEGPVKRDHKLCVPLIDYRSHDVITREKKIRPSCVSPIQDHVRQKVGERNSMLGVLCAPASENVARGFESFRDNPRTRNIASFLIGQ